MKNEFILSGGPLGGERVAFGDETEVTLEVPGITRRAVYALRTTEDAETGAKETQAIFTGMVR